MSRNGDLLYERGYGSANLELGVPITPASVFEVASVAKAFTAMSVLLLAEEGRLSLDDDVRRHVPEWANPESGVTIRLLLAHTSGLREAFGLLGWAGPADRSVDPNQALLAMLARQRPAPGTNTTTAATTCWAASCTGSAASRCATSPMRTSSRRWA